MIRRILFILILIVSSVTAIAQKVHVKASNEPLSSVIKRLNTEVSYNNIALSHYRVTVDKTFSSPYEAISYLIKGKPLKISKVSGVIIISEKTTAPSKKAKEKKTEYRFVIRKIPDTPPVEMNVSLKEILITAKSHNPSLKKGDADGTIKFNSFTARAMPGYSDNMVFNVLRMMPGMRASGEPSDELYVWGSSPGESRITYDGIPLFSMQSYNSNISYINPYMFDEVSYRRGILSADEGSQTGAKVDVISDMSDIRRPIFKGMISTMSFNGFGAIPIGSRSILSVAYRHTLEGLFGGTTFDAYRERENKNQSQGEHNGNNSNTTSNVVNNSTSTAASDTTTTNTSVSPKYRFQDININFISKGKNNTLYKLSLYGAKDYLSYNTNDTLTSSESQTSYTGGASAHFSKVWDNSNKSELSSAFSELYSYQDGNVNSNSDKFNFSTNDRVVQFNLKYTQSGIGKLHGLVFGGELTTYRVDTSMVKKTAIQPTLYANQKLNIGDFNIEAGLRTDMMSDGVKWQPRILLKYHTLNYFTISSSWGIYQQYLIKNPTIIHENMYKFSWDLNTSLKSYNTVAGISFDKGGLNISAEGYIKQIRHSVWVVDNQLGVYDFNIRGIDVSSKYNGRHTILYASWSLAKDPRQTNSVSNEIKAGGILRIHPFTFSANYIFGKGYNSMLLNSNDSHEGKRNNYNNNSGTTYSRMDIAISYDKRFKYFGISTGVSLINVFDTSNKKYVTLWVAHNYSSSLSAQASRFTPILFFEIKI